MKPAAYKYNPQIIQNTNHRFLTIHLFYLVSHWSKSVREVPWERCDLELKDTWYNVHSQLNSSVAWKMKVEFEKIILHIAYCEVKVTLHSLSKNMEKFEKDLYNDQ